MDGQLTAMGLAEGLMPAPYSSTSELSLNTVRMLDAIVQFPEDERGVFELIRIQGISRVGVAELLGVAAKKVQRRLRRALLLLMGMLSDLQ